jgi:NADH:ubiquinone oxidoreductase subunit K
LGKHRSTGLEAPFESREFVMGVSILFAVPLLVVGWTGLHLRKSVIGGAVAILIVWQGVLALAALSVFQRSNAVEGAVLLWFFIFGALVSVVTVLVIGLRRYYSDRDVRWRRNEELRH